MVESLASAPSLRMRPPETGPDHAVCRVDVTCYDDSRQVHEATALPTDMTLASVELSRARVSE